MAVYTYIRAPFADPPRASERVAAQQTSIHDYLAQQGIAERSQEFHETDAAGDTSFLTRPGGGALLEHLKPGDNLVVASLDRLATSPGVLNQALVALRTRRVRLHVVDLGGDLETHPPNLERMADAFLEAERCRNREKRASAKRRHSGAQRYQGGRLPIGQQVSADGQLVRDPGQVPIIIRMQALHTEGCSLRSIVKSIKEEFGLDISHEGVRKVLQRERRASQGQSRGRAMDVTPR